MTIQSSPGNFRWEQLPPQNNHPTVPGDEPELVDPGVLVPVQTITFLDRGTISAYPAGMTLSQMPQLASVQRDSSPHIVQDVYTYNNGVTIGTSVLGTFFSLDINVARAVRKFDVDKSEYRLERSYDGNYLRQPWRFSYLARKCNEVAGAFFRASDTLILPQVPRDKGYGNGWRTLVNAAAETEKPRDVMERVNPIARLLLELDVHIADVDTRMKKIEERAQAMGIQSDGAASEEDSVAKGELTRQKRTLIDQALGHKTEIESIAGAEQERVDLNKLVASAIPEGLPKIPEVQEVAEAIQRVFSNLFAVSKNDFRSKTQVSDAAASMSNSIKLLEDPTGIMTVYANFVKAWAQNGLKMPSAEALREDIVKHRKLR